MYPATFVFITSLMTVYYKTLCDRGKDSGPLDPFMLHVRHLQLKIMKRKVKRLRDLEQKLWLSLIFGGYLTIRHTSTDCFSVEVCRMVI